MTTWPDVSTLINDFAKCKLYRRCLRKLNRRNFWVYSRQHEAIQLAQSTTKMFLGGVRYLFLSIIFSYNRLCTISEFQYLSYRNSIYELHLNWINSIYQLIAHYILQPCKKCVLINVHSHNIHTIETWMNLKVNRELNFK